MEVESIPTVGRMKLEQSSASQTDCRYNVAERTWGQPTPTVGKLKRTVGETAVPTLEQGLKCNSIKDQPSSQQ
jgi:hypothetical protein